MSVWEQALARLASGSVGRCPRVARLQSRLDAAGLPDDVTGRVVRRVQGGEWVRAALIAEGAPDDESLDVLCGTAVFNVHADDDGYAATTVTECDECERGFVRVATPGSRDIMRRCRCYGVARQAGAVQAARLPFDLVDAVRTTPWLADHPKDGNTGGLVDVAARDEVRATRRKARAAMARWTRDTAATLAGETAARPPCTVALCGPPGTGKSRLLVDVGLRLAAKIKDREPVRFTTWVGLTDVVGNGGTKALDAAMSAPVLLIDEAAEDARAWQSREVRERLKQRHNRGLMTLLASNYVPGRRADGTPERGTWGYLTGAAALLDRMQTFAMQGGSFRQVVQAQWGADLDDVGTGAAR